jgi:hypothetical protein
MIVKATREKRFRPQAVRIDSTVIEADVKYPTDAGLAPGSASQGAPHLAGALPVSGPRPSVLGPRSSAQKLGLG